MLLDSYGLVYRSFFALPPLTTTRGMRIEAAYGFAMMVQKLIADEKPTHVIAAFDKGLPRSRVALYADYKAQRTETPDELRSQFALVRRVLATYGIPIVEMDGEEADDVIATLAAQAEAQGKDVLVVTGDNDLLQIVDEHTTVLDHAPPHQRAGALRRREGARALRARPAPIARLPRAQGRSVRQPARHPQHRREDRHPADQSRRFARRAAGRPVAGRQAEVGSADPRARRGRARLPRRLADQARPAAGAGLGERALRASVQRRALQALPRARVQDAAEQARAARASRSPSRRKKCSRASTSRTPRSPSRPTTRASSGCSMRPRRRSGSRWRRAATRSRSRPATAARSRSSSRRWRSSACARRSTRCGRRAAPGRLRREGALRELRAARARVRRRPDGRRAPARPQPHVRGHRQDRRRRAGRGHVPRPQAARRPGRRGRRGGPAGARDARRARAARPARALRGRRAAAGLGAGEDRRRGRRARHRGAARAGGDGRRRRRALAARDLRDRGRGVQPRQPAAARANPVRQARAALRAARTRPATRPAWTCSARSRAASRSRRRCWSTARSPSSRTPTSTCCRSSSRRRPAAHALQADRDRDRPALVDRAEPAEHPGAQRARAPGSARRSSRRRPTACCSPRTTRRSSCG